MSQPSEECQHEFERVTRPIKIEHDAKKRKKSEFKYSGATITLLTCKKCPFYKATDMEIQK